MVFGDCSDKRQTQSCPMVVHQIPWRLRPTENRQQNTSTIVTVGAKLKQQRVRERRNGRGHLTLLTIRPRAGGSQGGLSPPPTQRPIGEPFLGNLSHGSRVPWGGPGLRDIPLCFMSLIPSPAQIRIAPCSSSTPNGERRGKAALTAGASSSIRRSPSAPNSTPSIHRWSRPTGGSGT
jgi:hypothetical protein